MSPRRIVFYGNCQIQYIARVYAEQIAPFNDDTAQFLDINHTDFGRQHVRDFITNAEVLVDQVFDVEDPIPAGLIDPAKPRFRIPNMRGDFLWPFGTRERHPRYASFPFDYYYGHEYGDTFLNRMILRGVAAPEAVAAYLAVDFVKQRNLPRILEISTDRQQRRDRISGISIAGFMQDNLRSEHLFYSPGHPSERLLHLVARPVLVELAGAALAEQALAAQYQGFPNWRIVPLHPGVGRLLALDFVSDDARYLVYDEGYFTFEEYALRYMRGDYVPELAEALRKYSEIDANALLGLASTALARAPMSALTCRISAQALRRLGRTSQATEMAFRAASLEPENPQNIVEIVTGLMNGNDLPGAERWARLAISRFPRESQVYYILCDVLLARRNYAELEKYATFVAELHPGHVWGLLQAARHLFAAAKLDQASALAERALRLQPKSADVANLRADILRRQQEVGQAKPPDRASVRRRTDADLHAQLAQLLQQDNDPRGAEGHYRQAIKLDATVPEFHTGLANTLTQQGRHDDALAVLRDAPAK